MSETAVSNAAVPAARPGRRGLAVALIVQLRPRQWIKNFVCLAGLVFSLQLTDPVKVGQAALGFAAFCLLSSAVYIFNDLLDLEFDRRNPRTAARPLAAGELPVWLAGMVLLACLAGAGLLSARLGEACLWTGATYGVLNVFYSLGLKREVIADVMCIALGFVLRLLFGILAVGVAPTAWAVLCVFFLAIFLGFAKRRSELATAAADSSTASDMRPVLAQYSPVYLDLLLAMSAAMTMMCYAVFTVVSHKNPTLVVTIVPVAYCVLRYLMQVTIHGRGHSPEDILFSDKRLWLGVLVWVVLCVLILYRQVQLFVETGPVQ